MKKNKEPLFHAWGPYAKGYMGFSHIPCFAGADAAYPAPLTMSATARMDCVVVPSLHSAPAGMPNTTAPGPCHPWLGTTADLRQAQYRWELGLGPSEEAYAETTFRRLDDQQVLIRTRFVNHTDRTLDAVLNYFISMNYLYSQVGRAQIMDGVQYIGGESRSRVRYAVSRPWDEQQPDARPAGVFSDPRFTDGFGFGDRVANDHVPALKLQPWGVKAGDQVSFPLVSPDKGHSLAIRYRSVPLKGQEGHASIAAEALGVAGDSGVCLRPVSISLSGCAQGTITLNASSELSLVTFSPGEHFSWQPGDELTLTAHDNESGIEIDCLLIGPEDAIAASQFEMQALMPASIRSSEDDEGYILHFPSEKISYRLTPLNARTRQRWVRSGTLEDAEPMRYSNPHFTFDDLERPFSGSFARKRSTPGLWFNAIQPSILVPPEQVVDHFAILSLTHEIPEPMPQALSAAERIKGRLTGKRDAQAIAMLAATIQDVPAPFPDAPDSIRVGMGILRASLLQNLVYPIYTKDGWICHFTPGKRWDNLYTWDGGFIALGLSAARRELAEYMLDLYLAPLDDPEQAFVHHGSPVPVQWMTFREMTSGQPAPEQLQILRSYYRRARLFYEFLMGRAHASTTNPFHTGLLTTYDYFYSVSGMDDYPPQLLSHLKGIAHRVAPVITTSQAMLGARGLALLASRYLELTDDAKAKSELMKDIAAYRDDISRLSDALETHAWDEASGYYAYVLHDDAGNKQGILRHEDGDNLNRGFDGIYPLVAYDGRAPQQDRLIAHLKDDRALLTPYGLTAVDQSAPYFTNEGYWNGGVWFPHAWYIGKALLDAGEGRFLFELVQRQLSAWCKQANARWHSFEMLRAVSGEGAWHFSFSGLTSPLLNWAQSLYHPGTVTAGHGALLTEKATHDEGTITSLTFRQDHEAGLLQFWIRANDLNAKQIRACGLPGTLPGFRDTRVYLLDGMPKNEACQPLPITVEELLPGLHQITIQR